MFDGPRHEVSLRQGDESFSSRLSWLDRLGDSPAWGVSAARTLYPRPQLGEHLSQRVTRSDLCYGQIILASTIELGRETAARMGAGDRGPRLDAGVTVGGLL